MIKSSTILGLFALFLVSGAAIADQVSTTTQNKIVPSLMDNLKLTYADVFIGGSVNRPFSSLMPNVDTGIDDPTAPVVMKNWVALGYKFNPDVILSGVLYWRNYAREKNFQLRDPYLKLQHNKLYAKGDFNLYGDFRFGPGVSNYSQGINMWGSSQQTLIPSYDVPNTKWSLSLTGVLVEYLFSQPGTAANVEAYAGPQVNYNLTKKVSLFVLYEQDVVHKQGGALTDTWTGNFSDVEPGVSWDIAPNFNLTPELNIATGNMVSLDTTQFLINLTWKLL